MDITLITIAHRVETLALASKVIELEKGEIIDSTQQARTI
jgi:ABC-type bacteriocin/lantibiotic exporter with double-glycine peptidase domain